MIDWNAFTWEAFATLFTGFLAVGGASVIGWRQVGISDRQSQLLEQQGKLAALKYRSDLFERRFEVYEATARFLGAILAHADVPERAKEQRFLIAMDAAKFLFAPAVAGTLKEIWTETCQFGATKSTMRANYVATGSYGDGMPDKEAQQLLAFHDRLEKLSDIFGEELKLSELA